MKTHERVLAIGMAASGSSPGGLNTYAEVMSHVLRDIGYSVDLAVLSGKQSDQIDCGSSEAPLPLRVARFFLRTARSVVRARLVVCHFSLYGVAPSMLARLCNKRVIYVFHGPWGDESAAEGAGRVSAALKNACDLLQARLATDIVVASAAFEGLLKASHASLTNRSISIIHPAVDVATIARDRVGRSEARRLLGLPQEAFMVLSVRRLVRRMGLHELVEAMSLVKGATLLIAGEGPEKQRLQERVDTLGLECVKLLGRVTATELPLLYEAADVTVIPSLTLEGFGISAVESLASGTPVIATRVGGLPEIIEPVDERLLCRPSDIGELASALDRVRSGEVTVSAKECLTAAQRYSLDAHRRAVAMLVEQ